MTAEQIEMHELKKRIERIELEKDILKKATALLMSDSWNNSH
jgi:transposase